MQSGWSSRSLTPADADRALAEWFGQAHGNQFPLPSAPQNWLVMGGRGAGKTRLGAEWVNALVRGLPPFALARRRYARIALIGETLGDVREVMIAGVSGILDVARDERPRFEATRRRLVWTSGAVAQMFSSEDPESLRGPQFDAAWCDEIGCPAADKGPNQPNVFPDPKSTENAVPYFSNEGRSDIAMLRFLDAHAGYWDPHEAGFAPASNPVSTVYGGRMVDVANIYAWAWDARPFPAFPQQDAVWSDGANWHRGHWLNGRLEGAELSALVDAILVDHGLDGAASDAADGTVHGYVIDEPGSARAALEPLIELFDLAVAEEPDGLVLRVAGWQAAAPLPLDDLVVGDEGAVVETVRFPDHELPAEALVTFRDPFSDYQAATARAQRLGAEGRRQEGFGFPGVLEQGHGKALMADWLQRIWQARETVSLAVASYRAGLEPGALISLPEDGDGIFIITEVEDGLVRRIKARRIDRTPPAPWLAGETHAAATPAVRAGPPHVVFLDLPARSVSGAAEDQLRLAAWQKPWRSQVVYASPETTGYARRATLALPADLGRLVEPLAPGFAGRVHRNGSIVVSLFDAETASVSRLQLLNGANAVAIASTIGVWEVVQFETADEIAAGTWRLQGLLRGQLGTDDAMEAGAAAGADLVMLNDRIRPAGLLASEIGLPLNWRVGPSGTEFSTRNFAERLAAGGIRARLPLSPVHLRCRRQLSGDLVLGWMRRGRIDADDWAPSDIPLGEEREEYEIAIAPAGGAVVRRATVVTQAYTYAAATIAADFGALPAALDVTVRQFSVAAGLGLPATRRFTL